MLCALHLRSDVERKRMHGLDPLSRAGKQPGSPLYEPASTQAVYGRLLDLAQQVTAAGWPVIGDAAFLQAGQRKAFIDMATRRHIPFAILDIRAGEATLQQRVA